MTRLEQGRRVRAARVLAGFDTVEELSFVLNVAGLGTKTLRKVERGERQLRSMEAWALARVCGVRLSFFSAPRHALGAVENPQLEDVAA